MKQFSVTKPEDKKKEFITIEDALSARVMGNDSKLTIISGLGDVQSLSSFCGAVSKALDTAQEVASSGNVTKNEKDKRLAKRKEVSESTFVINIIQGVTGYLKTLKMKKSWKKEKKNGNVLEKPWKL